jgi:hypothetical protein
MSANCWVRNQMGGISRKCYAILIRQRAALTPINDQLISISNSTFMSQPSSADDKLALFGEFAGRTDVFPCLLGGPAISKVGLCNRMCQRVWVKGLCGKPRIQCGDCRHQAFIPVSDATIVKHLGGVDDLDSSRSNLLRVSIRY